MSLKKRKRKAKRVDYGEIIVICEKDLKHKRIDGRKVDAWCWDDGSVVQIQKGARGKRRLRLCVHELLHVCFPEEKFPNVTESSILHAEKILADVLWAEGYRRSDNKIF